jgi:serine/threonine-protein kinase MRCK
MKSFYYNLLIKKLIFFFTAYCDGHLLVYSETHLDIFNTQTGDWVQSIGLKKSKPLSFNGNLTSMYMNDSMFVVYLANMHTRELLNTERFLDREGRAKPKRKFSLREINKTIRMGSDRRKMISAPTNFNHVSHLGPDVTNRLLDLPTTVESVDSPVSANPRSTMRPFGGVVKTPQRLHKKPPLPAYPSSLPRSPSPVDSSVSSIHAPSERKSESRQSVTSNNSSSPPSPLHLQADRLSSSYDS